MAEIKWFGHGCFRVRAREALVILDPVGKSTGYSLPKQKADIVTVSHQHPGHTALGQIQDGYFLIDGPGEYEVNDVFLTGVRTFHDDKLGKERGYNTIYLLENNCRPHPVMQLPKCIGGHSGKPESEA